MNQLFLPINNDYVPLRNIVGGIPAVHSGCKSGLEINTEGFLKCSNSEHEDSFKSHIFDWIYSKWGLYESPLQCADHFIQQLGTSADKTSWLGKLVNGLKRNLDFRKLLKNQIYGGSPRFHTKIGPHGEHVFMLQNHIWVKSGFNTSGMKGYQILREIGVGVPFSFITSNCLVMIELEGLCEAITNKSISQAKALLEINRIQLALDNSKVVHCDVKPSNLGCFEGKLYLIDCNDVKNYGEEREVATIGNFTEKKTLWSGDYDYGRTKKSTDDKGFDLVRSAVMKLKLNPKN